MVRGTQGFCDPPAFFCPEHDPAKVVIDGMTIVEIAYVLRDHVQWFAKDTVCHAMRGMRMAGSIDIRPSFVEFAVDEESGSIDTGLIPIAQDMTGFIHEDEIR